MRGEKCNKEERRKSAAASSRRRIKDSPKRPINWSQSIFRMISQFPLFAVHIVGKISLNPPKSWGIPATTYTELYPVYRGGLFSSLPPSIFQTARVQKQRAERKEEETDEEEGASATSGMGRMTFRGWTNGGSSSSSFFFLLGWARRRRKSKKPPIFLFTAAQLNCPTKKGEMLPSTVYRAFSSETATSQQPSTKDSKGK